MFDKKETHHHYLTEKAAKELAKGRMAAEKMAAKIQASAEEKVAKQERKSREEVAKLDMEARKKEAEWSFARENPEAYLEKRKSELELVEKLNKPLVGFLKPMFMILITMALVPISIKFLLSDNQKQLIIAIVLLVVVLIMWFPAIKKHLKS